jgi:hypothetical protein
MRIVFGHDRVELCSSSEVAPADRILLDFDAASRLLRRSMNDALDAGKLRRLLPSSTYAVLSDWSDRAVVEQLAHNFASGKLCIVAKDAKSQ